MNRNVLALLCAFLPALACANWSPVELTNPELRAKGVRTGDGAQWVRGLAVDGTDGRFMIWATDVGGLFRSLDGGLNWEPTNVGFNSRGATAVAIDPHNPRRAIVIAANSVVHPANGIYLTTDQAASWRQVASVSLSATVDDRRQVAFDPSTYDAENQLTRVVYWSRLTEDRPKWGDPVRAPGFLRSEDGGETWTRLPGGEMVADALLAVDPQDGTIYAGTPRGLFRSQTRGDTWQHLLEDAITGLSTSTSAPGEVFLSTRTTLLHSRDRGDTWHPTPFPEEFLTDPKTIVQNLAVAPSDPRHQVLMTFTPPWSWRRYYSHDGGDVWTRSEIRRGRSIIPMNARQALFAFHPINPLTILSTGGDFPTLSLDGGATYVGSGNGVNNLLIGGAFNFSVIDPDILFISSQDYATLLTTDGGKNWSYFEPGAKGWGGFNYGAYASTADVLVVGESASWGGPRQRAVSRDSGQSWDISPTELLQPDVSYGAPGHPDILFAGGFRSTDAGQSWQPMTGASSVHTHDPLNGDLYGVAPAEDDHWAVVRSADAGESWSPLFTVATRPLDLAVDTRRGRVYLANGELQIWENGHELPSPVLPHDQEGCVPVLSVAVDPQDPDVIYVAGNRNNFASNASARRSLDGGLTWTNLTRQTPLDGTALDGGRESFHVRVHPRTREAWFATGCYGLWKHAAPTKP